MSPIRAIALAFEPDDATPVSVLWGLLFVGVALPIVGWLLTEDDEPHDLGGID